MRGLVKIVVILAVFQNIFVACSPDSKFGLAPKEDKFSQKSDIIQTKLDVLWVIDTSGSMATSQANLANSFNAFIAKMKEKKFDYQIAVTTTDAWQAFYVTDPSISDFKTGVEPFSSKAISILTPSTPNLENVFSQMANQGINGASDERSLQSLMAALKNEKNKVSFPRSDAYLSVIFLTDEDDFSNNSFYSIQGQYTNPNLHTVSSYVDFMDWVKGATPEDRSKKYALNTIAILDDACQKKLTTTSFKERIIAKRLIEATQLTGGFTGSLCEDFSSILSNLADTILRNSTKFYLTTIPDPKTISVYVNNVLVPNDATNGWTYDATENAISFNGDAVPGQNASISIKFDRVAPGA